MAHDQGPTSGTTRKFVDPKGRILAISTGITLLVAMTIFLVARARMASEAAEQEEAQRKINEANQARESTERATTDLEADDALIVLRRVWKAGLAADLVEQMAACEQKPKGLAAIQSCFTAAMNTAQTARGSLPPRPFAKARCGTEIEEAHWRHVEGQIRWAGDTIAWIERNKPLVDRATTGRSLAAACEVGTVCDGKPVAGADYATVMAISCTKSLFRCGSPDSVCTINKVAARLGLGPDAKPTGPQGELAVRSNGRMIVK